MTTITKEKILETAERLKAEGKNPTQVTVRAALGGGSFATIGPVLKDWKDGQKEDHALAEIQVPEAITDRLEQLQGAVWQAAVDEAERRLTAERESLKAAQGAAAAEVAEQLESVATLEAEAEQLRQTIERLVSETEAQASTVQRLETELSDVKANAEKRIHAEHETASKEGWRADAAAERAERAEAQLAAVQQDAKADREVARTDLSEQKKAHDAEIEKLNKAIEEARKAAAAAVKKAEESERAALEKAAKSEKEAQQRGAGEQACQVRLEFAQREAEQTQERVSKLEEKADKAAQEAAELRGELKAFRQSDARKPVGKK